MASNAPKRGLSRHCLKFQNTYRALARAFEQEATMRWVENVLD